MLHDNQNSVLPLSDEEMEYLDNLSKSRSASVLRARSAAMLLRYADGIGISDIARAYRSSVTDVNRSIDKALRQEIFSAREKSLKKRNTRAITKEMVEWVRDLSYQNPRNLGYSCVEWPVSLLAQHVRDHCRAVGYHALAGLRCVEMGRLLARTF